MHALVVYESMFGNTRRVAEAIAEGLRESLVTRVVSIADSAEEPSIGFDLDFDLVVAGGPTHVHGMSWPRTRSQASTWAADPRRDLRLEHGAEGDGIREWLDALSRSTAMSAAFDTRSDIPQILSGAASDRIGRDLRRHGLRPISAPMSFLVDTDNHLRPDELPRAHAWGSLLGRTAVAAEAGDVIDAP